MNERLLNLLMFVYLVAFAVTSTDAQVPSLINYQGRLTDSNGSPVTGSKSFVIRLFNAQTGGALLYTEDLGTISLGNNGVYNFQFGSAGSSNSQVTETIATTDGIASSFDKILINSPVVSGSVSVTDGAYTWSESNGSSNEEEFGVTYSPSLNSVTVNYYSVAPTSGRNITTTYRHVTSGIVGALGTGATEHWLELSVDGTTQTVRQRIVAVPFAFRSAVAEQALEAIDNEARRQLSEMLTSISAGRSIHLSTTLEASANLQGGLIQATATASFASTFGGTFEVSPHEGSSKLANFFVVKRPQLNRDGWYEIQYADGQVLRFPVATTDPQWLTVTNPNPDKEVAVLRGSFTANSGGATTDLRIYTPEEAVASYSVAGAPAVERGALVLYSSNSEPVNIRHLTLNLEDGRTIAVSPGLFTHIGSKINSITVKASSTSLNADISVIKLHY